MSSLSRWLLTLMIVALISTGAGYGCSALFNIGNDANNNGFSNLSQEYTTLEAAYSNDEEFKVVVDNEFKPTDKETKYKIKGNKIVYKYNIGDYPATTEVANIIKENLDVDKEYVNDEIVEFVNTYGFDIRVVYKYINSNNDTVYRITFGG